MSILLYLSQVTIPLLLFLVIGCGLIQHIPIYDTFVRGAKEGLHTVTALVPTMIGLMIATGVLRASGILDFAASLLEPLVSRFSFPAALLPLTFLRMFSSSAATGLLLDIYKEFGTDSFTGLTASLMMCCTETIFYTMSVYFMAAGIKKTRHTLCGALLSSFAGIAASVVLAGWMQ
jgi:spore maturation protein B